jgi:hypothetical protein
MGRGGHDSIAIAQLADAATCFRMTFAGASKASFRKPPSSSGTVPLPDHFLRHEGGDISPETAADGIFARRNSVFRNRWCRDLLYRGGRQIRLANLLETDHRAGALAPGRRGGFWSGQAPKVRGAIGCRPRRMLHGERGCGVNSAILAEGRIRRRRHPRHGSGLRRGL